jgi:hypothetical protein
LPACLAAIPHYPLAETMVLPKGQIILDAKYSWRDEMSFESVVWE